MKQICLASLAVAAMLTAGCSRHNERTANDTAGTAGHATNVSRGDRDFVQDVAQLNTTEVDLSRTAADRSSNPEVKKFAQMVVADHTAAGQKLNDIAAQNAIEAPTSGSDSERSQQDKLSAKQGADFDRDYVDAMVDSHGKLIDKLESRIDHDTLSKWKDAKDKTTAPSLAPEKSDDPVTQRINEWAAQTYPAAYNHQETAKSLKDSLKK